MKALEVLSLSSPFLCAVLSVVMLSFCHLLIFLLFTDHHGDCSRCRRWDCVNGTCIFYRRFHK